jgi:hypothetical protein
LAEIVADHRARYLPSQGRVALSLAGGLWSQSNAFVAAFEVALAGAGPIASYSLQQLKKAPVQGAVQLAKEIQDRH